MLDEKRTEISEEMERQFLLAVEFVWAEGKCSTSFVQRKLGIGYNAAARIVERMEALGIVSKANHVGKREVRSREELRKALRIRKENEEIAGPEATPILLKAIAEGLRSLPAFEAGAAEARDKMEEKARRGRAPMKNDPDFRDHNDATYRVTASELRQFIERFERLEAEKKDIAEQQKEVMAEAKARGYDTKVMRKVVALRKRDKDDIAEEEAVLEMYKEALGMS
jgi:uncharacterized protein (UPF0335 family)